MDPLNAVVTQLANTGIQGVIIAALLLWVFRLMKQIENIQQARIEDEKAFMERALQLQEGVHRSVERLEAIHRGMGTRPNRDE